MCEWIATMLMPASRNDFRAGCRSFSVTAKSPSTTAFSSLPAKAYPGVDPHHAIDSHAMLFRGTPESEFYHALVHLTAAAKNFIQWIDGNCADVRQGRLEEGIGGRRVGGA